MVNVNNVSCEKQFLSCKIGIYLYTAYKITLLNIILWQITSKEEFVLCEKILHGRMSYKRIWIFIKPFCGSFLLIHSANPQSRLVGIIVFAYVVRPSVRPHFSNLAKQNNRKQCLLLAWLWVWPSGSLMTPVLSFIVLPLVLTSVISTRWGFP